MCRPRWIGTLLLGSRMWLNQPSDQYGLSFTPRDIKSATDTGAHRLHVEGWRDQVGERSAT